LAARADLAVRRNCPRDAAALVAEANALGDGLPSTVRADLALLGAEIALLDGDSARARVSLDALAAELRASDDLVGSRALLLEARATLASLPVDRRRASRLAIHAVRRARRAGLAELERDALAALRTARTSPNSPSRRSASSPASIHPTEAALWDYLSAARSEPREALAQRLASLILAASGAERVVVTRVDSSASVLEAWGMDVDGLPLARPAERLDLDMLKAARISSSHVYNAHVQTKGGIGARLAVAGDRAVVFLEHRFLSAAFDGVETVTAHRWAILADIAMGNAQRDPPPELSPSVLPSSVSSSSGIGPHSTAFPVRGVTRDYPHILGRSAAMLRALGQLEGAIETTLPVLVLGETGTGKELFARALHDHGARAKGPFVAVNCAAIADSLFEAELFGHARGAFTGADRPRAGLIALAEGGTLFLDEIGELPLARQATLLRALESRRFRAVGADEEKPFDVRIVAATNRDLDAAATAGTFRSDLLYRLRVLVIDVPPLRRRDDDVIVLLKHFLAASGCKAQISDDAIEAFLAYEFPGNVRELAHLAQRISASNPVRIDHAHLPRALRKATPRTRTVKDPAERERREAQRALAKTSGNITRAAALLGITRHGLKKRMLRLGLREKVEGT
jgi:transcriptional regulator with AAA-type ATPase domain